MPEFDRSLPSLLDRGVVYAVAHVRGGGERGRYWWQQGRLRAKPTTFSDFIEVADWLAGDARARAAGRRPPDRVARAVGRRPAAGRGLLARARPVAGRRGRGAVRRLRHHDARPVDPADHQRVGRVGRSARPRGLRLPAVVLAIRQSARWGAARPAGHRRRARPAGAGPRAGEMGGAAARDRHRRQPRCCSGSELGAGAHTGPSGRFGHLRYEAEVQAFILAALGLAGGPAS